MTQLIISIAITGCLQMKILLLKNIHCIFDDLRIHIFAAQVIDAKDTRPFPRGTRDQNWEVKVLKLDFRLTIRGILPLLTAHWLSSNTLSIATGVQR